MESGADRGTAVESLEALAEEIFRRGLEYDQDGEAELEQLISDFVRVGRGSIPDEEFVRQDEFACRSCRMILHRSRLADRGRLICVDCAAGNPPE